MITEDQFKAAAECNTLQILNACKGGELMQMLLPLSAVVPGNMLSTVFALLMGSLCADAELEGCESDKEGLVTFEDRMRLFTIYACTSYQETYLKAKELGFHAKDVQ